MTKTTTIPAAVIHGVTVTEPMAHIILAALRPGDKLGPDTVTQETMELLASLKHDERSTLTRMSVTFASDMELPSVEVMEKVGSGELPLTEALRVPASPIPLDERIRSIAKLYKDTHDVRTKKLLVSEHTVTELLRLVKELREALGRNRVEELVAPKESLSSTNPDVVYGMMNRLLEARAVAVSADINMANFEADIEKARAERAEQERLETEAVLSNLG